MTEIPFGSPLIFKTQDINPDIVCRGFKVAKTQSMMRFHMCHTSDFEHLNDDYDVILSYGSPSHYTISCRTDEVAEVIQARIDEIYENEQMHDQANAME